MAKYIDAEKLIEKGSISVSMCASSDYAHGHNDFFKVLCETGAEDVAPVVHGRWKYYKKQGIAVCTNCSFERKLEMILERQFLALTAAQRWIWRIKNAPTN